MTKTETIKKAKEALEYLKTTKLIPNGEYQCLKGNLRGEEKEGIAEIILRVYNTFKTMPKTYETENVKDKIVHLHYFRGSNDYFIVEKDMEEDEQIQAFGMVRNQYGDELGYCDLTSLTACGVELDLYWTPKPLSECK